MHPPVFESGPEKLPARPVPAEPNTASFETSAEGQPVGSWNKWFEVS